jgi:hypothetical protein
VSGDACTQCCVDMLCVAVVGLKCECDVLWLVWHAGLVSVMCVRCVRWTLCRLDATLELFVHDGLLVQA